MIVTNQINHAAHAAGGMFADKGAPGATSRASGIDLKHNQIAGAGAGAGAPDTLIHVGDTLGNHNMASASSAPSSLHFGSARLEEQSGGGISAGASSSGSSYGGISGSASTSSSCSTAGDSLIDEESSNSEGEQANWNMCIQQAHWRNSKFTSLILIVLLGVAAAISLELYMYLHHQELLSFRSTLQLLCAQRGKTFVDHFQLAEQAMAAIGGLMALQNKFLFEYHFELSRTDWYSYVSISAVPTFLDQTVWIPYVTDAQRPVFEEVTGPITDIGCTNPNQTIYTGCTPPNPADPLSAYDFFHYRQQEPYYFPYQYYYPNFSGANPILNNPDAAFLFPFQGVPLTALTQSVASTTLTLSIRQLLKAALSGLTPPEYGSIAALPIYTPGFTPTPDLSGNWTHNAQGLVGVVAVVVRVKSVLEESIDALGGTGAAPMIYNLFDASGAVGSQFLTMVADPVLTNLNYGENVTVDFPIGERIYALQCSPDQSFVNSAYSSTPLYISVGSAILVFINILFVIMAVMYVGMRRAVNRANLLAKSNANKSVALSLLAEAKELAERATSAKTVR